jgi:hypothetical protein
LISLVNFFEAKISDLRWQNGRLKTHGRTGLFAFCGAMREYAHYLPPRRPRSNSFLYERKNRRISPAVSSVLGGLFGIQSWEDCLVLADSLASNLADVFAGDAEIAEFAIGHAAKFGNGLAILHPVVVSARDVHGHFLSTWAASVLVLPFNLMTGT